MENEKTSSRIHLRWGQLIDSGKTIWAKYQSDHGMLAAAAVAFYLTLAMVPLLLLLISIAAYVVEPAQVQTIVRNLTSSFGSGVGDALRSQVLSVMQHRGVLTGVSLVLGLWAASQVFVIMESALNVIWDVEEKRSFFVRRALALVMVVVTGVLALLAVALTYGMRVLRQFGIAILGMDVRQIPWSVVIVFNFVLPWVIIMLAFMFIYRFLSARRVTWGMAWPGAAIAGVLWTLVLQIFSWYTGTFANYSVLYGSLGGLILLMLWFNYSAMILLLGAEVSSVIHQNRTATISEHK